MVGVDRIGRAFSPFGGHGCCIPGPCPGLVWDRPLALAGGVRVLSRGLVQVWMGRAFGPCWWGEHMFGRAKGPTLYQSGATPQGNNPKTISEGPTARTIVDKPYRSPTVTQESVGPIVPRYRIRGFGPSFPSFSSLVFPQTPQTHENLAPKPPALVRKLPVRRTPRKNLGRIDYSISISIASVLVNFSRVSFDRASEAQ